MTIAYADLFFISGVIFFPIAAARGALGGAIWFTVAFAAGGLLVGLTVCYLGRKVSWSAVDVGVRLADHMKPWAQGVLGLPWFLFYMIFPFVAVGAGAAGTFFVSIWLARLLATELSGWNEFLAGCSATILAVGAVVLVYRRMRLAEYFVEKRT